MHHFLKDYFKLYCYETFKTKSCINISELQATFCFPQAFCNLYIFKDKPIIETFLQEFVNYELYF